MPFEGLAELRAAGRIAAAVRELARLWAVTGGRASEISIALEAEIARRGARLAFPVQCSVNDVAAHFCATNENDVTLKIGDLAKFDIGVHLEGWIVDTAVTINIGDEIEGRRMVEASQAALDAGIAAMRPYVAVREISAAIERVIHDQGLSPLRELSGHCLGRYQVHAPPPIPNVAESAQGTLRPGMIVAIETFVNDGNCVVRPQGVAEIFRVDPINAAADLDRDILDLVRQRQGLPFSRRQLDGFSRDRIESMLFELERRGLLSRYPPLVQVDGRPVAQAEHTLFVGETEVENLTL